MRIQVQLILLSLTLCSVKSCKYKKFSENHSFCKKPNKNCELQNSEVTDKDIKDILQMHNEYRLKIATGKENRAGGMPEAANMIEMVWDKELAAVAQSWANQCEFKHDCPDCRTVERFSVGQNIYTISSTEDVQATVWEKMIDNFYKEVQHFNKKYINPFQSRSNYGHFTQLVWATSWLVGCGKAVYKEDELTTYLLVCNYGPAGNIDGDEMYKEGKPCTKCPSETCCDKECKKSNVVSDYPGLCKVLDENTFKIKTSAQ